MSGNSTYVDDIGAGPFRVTVLWSGTMTWDRQTGYVTHAEFHCTRDGVGGLYWYADLDMGTGAYTIIDNSATVQPPYILTIADTGYAGSDGSVTVTEAGVVMDLTFVDSGHGLGPDHQHIEVTLSDPYTKADAQADAEDMLKDLTTVVAGDWNKEFNYGYSSWPPVVTESVYEPCAGESFPPYSSRIYGSETNIADALAGNAATSFMPGRVLHMPLFPESTGWINFNYPGPSLEARPDLLEGNQKFIFVGKLRASPHAQTATLFSIEQNQCDCVPTDANTLMSCSPDNYLLSGITDCDLEFFDPASTTIDTDLFVDPGDQLFEYGFGYLWMSCLTGPCPFNFCAVCCP